MLGVLNWPLNTSRGLSATAEFLTTLVTRWVKTSKKTKIRTFEVYFKFLNLKPMFLNPLLQPWFLLMGSILFTCMLNNFYVLICLSYVKHHSRSSISVPNDRAAACGNRVSVLCRLWDKAITTRLSTKCLCDTNDIELTISLNVTTKITACTGIWFPICV